MSALFGKQLTKSPSASVDEHVSGWCGIFGIFGTFGILLKYHESGEREAPYDVLEKVSDLFGCDMYVLFEENKNAEAMILASAFRLDGLTDSDSAEIMRFKDIVMCLKSSGGERLLLINSNQPLSRQHFTIAHELYHLFIEKNPIPHNCEVEGTKSETEQYADAFALLFLILKVCSR